MCIWLILLPIFIIAALLGGMIAGVEAIGPTGGKVIVLAAIAFGGAYSVQGIRDTWRFEKDRPIYFIWMASPYFLMVALCLAMVWIAFS